MTAAPAFADTYGTSQTLIFGPASEIPYGDAVGLAAEVKDVSDSCTSVIHSCNAPHGTVDFYAVQGATQSFLGTADLWPDIEIFGPWSDTFADGIPAPDYCCLEPGTYVLRGYYVPGDFDPSSDDSDPFTVTKNGSTTTIAADDTSAVAGQTVNFTLHVSPYSDDPRAAAPTGSVDVREGTTSYGTGIVGADGNATVSTALLPAGTHSLRAYYSGDSHWTASTSAALDVTVDAGATNSSLSASATNVTYGDDVTLTTTVQVVAPASGTPTGTVAFNDGGVDGPEIGTATLNEDDPDQAALTISSLGVGSHLIQAFYGGDDYFNSSTTNSVTVNVAKAATETSLTSSANPSAFGTAVTFTASVSGPGSTTVDGTVQFKDGSVPIGSPQSLVAGSATLTIGTLAGGTHAITAVYSGSASFYGSTSAVLSQSMTCDHTVTGSTSSLAVSATGSTCLFAAKVSGNVSVPSGASLSILNSSIGGNLVAGGGAGSITICGSVVAGPVRITGATGFLLFGDLPDDACAGNWFKANVTLHANTGGLAAADNRTGGSVAVTDNIGSGPGPDHLAPIVAANVIGGQLYVTGNSPAATDDGRANIVHGKTVVL